MTAINIEHYGFLVSLKRYFEDKYDIPCDILYDGYKWRDEKPFMTIEQMQNNYEYNVKRREAVEVVYRAQVGLHASNGVERMRLQERINNGLSFDEIEYRSGEETSGFFDVEITGIVPMPSDDITDRGRRHTVYFDIELNTYKRSC